MYRKKKLEQAAFWDEAVCLDCGHIQSTQGECDECDSEAVYKAELVLRCAEFVGEEED